jgi:hypothetical protein
MLRPATTVIALSAAALTASAAFTYREIGDRITLAGRERAATRMDVMMRIGNSGVATFNAQLRLYNNDGPSGSPGSLIWDSGPVPKLIDSGADLAISFNIPTVLVPDSFTWTLQVTDRTGNQQTLSLSHYDPPTAGSVADGYWSRNGGAWVFTPGHHPFGARVQTVGACSPDFNHDGDTGTDQDLEAFFACLAGNCCATCDSADFNHDGDTGTDQDIEAFFRVLAGGSCT